MGQGIEQVHIKTLQEDILDLLHIRLEAVTAEVEERITAVTDISTLRQLHRLAATADTLTIFTGGLDTLAPSD